MNPLISICVPTYHRPALLRIALQSLTRQAYRPLEIIVGDNSENDASREVVDSIDWPEGVTVCYHRHRPSLDVVQNFNWLCDRASGGRIMLLHDDDLLCDGGLDMLVAAWDSLPDTAAAFGRMQVINEAGDVLPSLTEEINKKHARTAEYAGHKLSNLESGLRQQIAMHSYLMDASLLKSVKFRPLQTVGMSTDADFGIRAAIAAGERPFVYLDRFVFRYRLTSESILRSRCVEYGHLEFLEEMLKLQVPPESEPSKSQLLCTITRNAVLDAAKRGDRRGALRLLRSAHYRFSWLHPVTLYRLMYIASPDAARAFNRVFRRLPS